ncbi:hypothetical protein QLL95_gp1057 [Cotonvirus japonicus]|uniref:Uncharacterized protein n=1 Tax=Cotonvirus japonicus TaxID=2811091 RepID=A0ABM7NSH9_9VIRU|nr:hypothetical protein QLL95_gp1057 [Cotonvirus japonicus]BCS83066.1 hypothetical protein [Cotonvirus japonicus]
MYVNQIDDIIDEILNKLYLDGLSRDASFNDIINSNKINFIEYREQINNFIGNFIDNIDTTEIRKIINNRENLNKIMDIIKRYVAYYYFLSIAYYYAGNIKDFRNNMIQYSKLQENSTFSIKNFFDTQNNYQLIKYFKIIKDTTKILLMTDLQKKTLNPADIKDTIDFLNGLGKEYIDNYLLSVIVENNEDAVNINVHNLIKTIVFGEIYKNQERNFVFEIINDIEEDEEEYTYIDIVVSNDDTNDLNNFKQIFVGEDDSERKARDLYELVNETNQITSVKTVETKNNDLFKYDIITPVIDDFLRYHRDSEKLDTETSAINVPLVSDNNAKNVQQTLLYQQRKKKDNTRAQIIVNKLDSILDYYSPSVKNNPEFLSVVKKYFQNPLSYRKAILHNYLDEVTVVDKIRKQGTKVIENNEYFLELLQIIHNAYFLFKDFNKYGASVNLFNEKPINMLRYSNIEYQNQMDGLEVDMHTGTENSTINLVGLALGPFNNDPKQCTTKKNLIDIRTLKITYMKNGNPVTRTTNNGFKAFLKIVKHFYVNTLSVREHPEFVVYNNYTDIERLNPDLFDKIIYWVYDIDLDIFEMDTYENLKSNSNQDIIRFMNSLIYDKINGFIEEKLTLLIENNLHYPLSKMETMIQLYSEKNHLFLDQNETRELIVKEYLQKLEISNTKIPDIEPVDASLVPMYQPFNENKIFVIDIDTINPLNPQPYIKLEAYSRTTADKTVVRRTEGKCKHESEWNEINKIKYENLNKYNSEITAFIEKYSLETTQLDYVCNVCGQILPLKQYVQDGSFNNTTQKFVTAYVPIDIPLEEIREYSKYKLTVKFLDTLINRVSLITNTNMLVGPNNHIQQKRKALVKNIIDIIVKHNSVNLKKNINDDERLEFFAKHFGVNKDLNKIVFFELDDNIFDFRPSESDIETSAKRLKFNNVLLYFIMIFITELNGIQISMMASDKIAGNIFIYLKYGQKLFENLLIKKNINGTETVPITNYPVLCYLLFILSYYLVKYKLWYQPGENNKAYNPYYTKIIINSFVDLFNSISMDTGKMPNDYVYMLTTSKFYSQLNTTFKDNDIINKLMRNQAKYDTRSSGIDVTQVIDTKIPTYSIENPIIIPIKSRKIPDFKTDSGIIFDRIDQLLYQIQITNTDITNCPTGSYHNWIAEGTELRCSICGELGDDVNGNIDRTLENYYYNLNIIANRRCIAGTLHDFVGKNGELVCTICGRKPNKNYDKKDLDDLINNINHIEDENAKKLMETIDREIEKQKSQQQHIDNIRTSVVNDYLEENGGKFYGQLNNIAEKLIKILEIYLGQANLDVDKYPVYLRDNVYIIENTYDGTPLDKPVIFLQKDNRVLFRENNPFFKTDVYYYTDNRSQVDVFYHAVTLKQLGYREKHKDYVRSSKNNYYLKINYSIMARLLTLGYKSKYINIDDIFVKNNTDQEMNYFKILDNLIKDHILKIRAIIDKISTLIYKIKNYQKPDEEDNQEYMQLQSVQTIDRLVFKYFNIVKNFNIGPDDTAFDDWNYVRNTFSYQHVDWKETDTRLSENLYVNTDLINYYDVSSSEMINYMVNELISIIDSNNEKIVKTNLSQMIVEIIIYVYDLYNVDTQNISTELKRYEYIINASPMIIDMLRKGQGLEQSRELEIELDESDNILDMEATPEEADELEDIKEEAEALDIEGDYYAEEDEDFAQEE